MRNLLIKLLTKALNRLLGYDIVYELTLSKQRVQSLERSKFVIPDEVESIMFEAKSHCTIAEASGRSGGFKRAMVVTQLKKLGIKERDAALAIELAVRSIK